jgi:AraC-like DNA-binding protein
MDIKNTTDAIYHGATWNHLNLNLIRIYDNIIPDYAILKNVRNTFYQIWLIRYGYAHLKTQDESFFLEPGDWCVSPPYIPRDHEFLRDAKIISIAVRAEWPNGKSLFAEKRPIIFKNSNFKSFEEISVKLNNIVKKHIGFTHDFISKHKLSLHGHLKINELFYKWFDAWVDVMIANNCEPQIISDLDPRISSVIMYLNGLNFTPKAPYDQLHKISGLSRVHLDRLFKKQMGLSPSEYLNKRCLDKATSLISSTNFSFKEICFQLGFANLSHFCIWFKRKTGYSPKDFRKRGLGIY